MNLIYAYRTADGAVHLEEDEAVRHLKKMEEPHASALLTMFRYCDGKQRGFIDLLDNPEFFAHVVALNAIRSDREILDTTGTRHV